VSYWVYENWTAEDKAVVHRGDCGQCNDGHGCHKNIHGNKNGQWLGPYSALSLARAAADATRRAVRKDHRCTKWP